MSNTDQNTIKEETQTEEVSSVEENAVNPEATQDANKESQEEAVEENTEVELEEITKEDLKEDVKEIPEFRAGDTVRVYYKIIEGDKTRIQPYEGIVIAKKGKDAGKTFTVRRIGVDSIGVERIFPLFSPNIQKIEVKKKGKVRRAKLYYLRDKKGKEAMRIKEIKPSK